MKGSFIGSLHRLLLIVLLFFVSCSNAQFYSKRELAPSLTLDRLNALKDSIDMLNDASKRRRCQLKASLREKRMISPSLRLSELLDPLVHPNQQHKSQRSSEYRTIDLSDPCVAFYDDIPYYY